MCAFTLAVQAQQVRAALTNDDIIKMTKDGFTESVIVTLIDSSDPAFDVSVNGLTALKEAGVTSKVMETMLKVDAKRRQSNAAALKSVAPAAALQTSVQTTAGPPPDAAVPSPAMSVPSAMGGAAMEQQMLASVMGGGSSGMLDMSQIPLVTLMIGEPDKPCTLPSRKWRARKPREMACPAWALLPLVC